MNNKDTKLNEEKPVEFYKNIILQLIASAVLCDHMGDMWDDLNHAAELIGEKDFVEDNELIAKKARERGITTIWGTEFEEEDEDNED